MEIIVVSGKARHGKDTVGDFIKQELNDRFEKRALVMHYADLLKFYCKEYFGWDGNKGETGRTLLQKVGTDVVRAQNPDYWVNHVGEFLSLFKDQWDYVIIPDARFKNEVFGLVKYGFIVWHWRVTRPDFDNGLTDEQKSHKSETELDNVRPDFNIINDGDLSNLDAKVIKALEEMI